MTQLRTDLIKMLANISDEPVKTMEALEQYILDRENDAVKTHILAGSPRALPETTPERMEGEQVFFK